MDRLTRLCLAALAAGLLLCPLTVDRIQAQGPPEVVPVSVREVGELRVRTDRTIIDSAGDEVPYYELRKPVKDHTFLDFRLQVAADYPMTLKAGDIHLGPLNGADPKYPPFDWFLDSGLAEERGDTLDLGTGAQIGFTVEVPRAAIPELGLFLWNRLAGPVGDMLPVRTSSTNPAPVQTVDMKVTPLDEYRMKTGHMRSTSQGSQPVYELRKPRPAHVFLEIEAQVAVDRYRELTGRDLLLRATVQGEEITYYPFDWFLQHGLEEVRGESVTLWSRGILTLLFEVPAAQVDNLVLHLGGTRAGRVGESH